VAETKSASSSSVLRFGVFQVNPAARELRKHGVRVRLPRQPFCILSMLLEKPGEIVTREEMQKRLWASGTFVDFEHSLNSAIKKLRAALGDSPENPRYIETVPRVGYRFIAPVDEILTAEKSASTTSAAIADAQNPVVLPVSRQRRWPALVGVFALLMLTATAGYFAWSRSRVRPQPVAARLMLAVLPFENLTGDAGQEYFSDGLTEEMIAQFGQVDPEHLGVIARTSVMHYKNNQKALDQIGRELAVQYVLEGSVRRDGDKVRVTAQLIDMKNQTPMWSRQYDRELSGLLALQGEIAQEIAEEIQLTLGSGHRVLAFDRKPPVPPNSYEAYDLYLKGRYFWNKRTKEGFQQAAEYFQQSVTKDPNYARAYAGLADTFALMGTWNLVPQKEFMPRARAAAVRALEIDETLAEAHTSLALIAEDYDYDWQTAEKEFKRAIQMDPSYPTAHQWYAECLSWQGRFEEALAESKRAQQLDPLSLIIGVDRAAILYFSRQYDRAIDQFDAVQAMEPNFPRGHMVTYVYVEKGMFAEALTEVKKWHHSDGTPVWEMEAYVHGSAGQMRQARQALAKWQRWSKSRHALTTSASVMPFVAMGRYDEAIGMLQKAYAERSSTVIEMGVAPYCDPLRGDPRFQDLLRRIGLVDSITMGKSTPKP
jgi:TolB-like protein/DNA-binding winged helix-turn-helix (wHTH) protein/Tfp pilus assembly protein PilF